MIKKLADIISNLNDDNFNLLYEQIRYSLNFHYLKEENCTKEIKIEKICDYFYTFERTCKLSDNDVLYIFTDTIDSWLNCKFEKNSREINYYNKYKELSKNLNSENKNLLNDINDISRLFVSFYYAQTNNKKFDFELSLDKLKKVQNDEKQVYKPGLHFLKKQENNKKDLKTIFVENLLTIFYLNMLNNKPESEIGK